MPFRRIWRAATRTKTASLQVWHTNLGDEDTAVTAQALPSICDRKEEAMTTFQRLSAWLTRAVREHWLALVILSMPIHWVVWQSEADTVVPFLLLPLVAFGVGYRLQPRHLWLLWLGSVVLEWVALGVWGKYRDPGPDETVASLLIEAFAWMLLGVLLPAWVGRRLRAIGEERHQPDRSVGSRQS